MFVTVNDVKNNGPSVCLFIDLYNKAEFFYVCDCG